MFKGFFMKNSKKSLRNFNPVLLNALLVSSMALTACGGSSSEPSPGPHYPEIWLTEKQTGDLFTGKPYLITNTGTARLKDYSVKARIGAISWTDPLTGENAPEESFYYHVPPETLNALEESGEFYGFEEEISVLDETGSGEIMNIVLGASSKDTGDPLFTDQWHIKNLGQNPFDVALSPVKGIDLNVVPAWHLTDSDKKLISGKGITVGVIDTPVDLRHEDLVKKIQTPKISRTYINKGLTEEEVIDDSLVLHGTAVSGIIAAEAANGKGVRGIAYDAGIVSYDHENADMTEVAEETECNIFNASIAIDSSYDSDPSMDGFHQAVFEKGIPFIKSIGNEYAYPDVYDAFDDDDSAGVRSINEIIYPTDCILEGVDCQYNQTSSLNRGRYIINVGSVNSLGEKSSYSSTGSFMWVASPAGEEGYSEGSSISSAAVVTTLSSLAPAVYDDWDAGAPWRNSSDFFDLRKFYTHAMDGTSAAAPSVTGVSALVMQAKPDITVPQFRYILATTSNNDRTPGWTTLGYDARKVKMPEFGGEEFTADSGWYANASGLRYSNSYGYGVVNADAAVRKALACDEDPFCARRAGLPDDFRSSNASPCSSSDGGRTVTCEFTDFVNLDDPESAADRIEIEQVSINLNSFQNLPNDDDPEICSDIAELPAMIEAGEEIELNADSFSYATTNLEITMTSPAGTKSIIKPVYALWDFNAALFKDSRDYSDYSNEYLVQNASYFTESFAPKERFTLNFRSKCSIDVDELNKAVHVLIGGYAVK